MNDSAAPPPSDDEPVTPEPDTPEPDAPEPDATEAGSGRSAEGESRAQDALATVEAMSIPALSPFEEGIASLFAGFERAVLSMGDPKEPAEDSEKATTDAPHASDAEAEPRPLPPGRTYDEVLAPIRWRTVLIALVVAALLVVLYFAVSYLQVWAAADNDDTQATDAIVVLGAAQFDGTPSPIFAARLDHAFDLWEDGLAEFIVTTGSKQEGDRFTEGIAGYLYLRNQGVPDDALIPIVDGEDTWQQLSATANQLEQRDLTTTLLVSDGYHTYRLLAIADEVGLEAYVSPTQVQPTSRDYLREATAVSIGRVIGYRRVSAVSTPD